MGQVVGYAKSNHYWLIVSWTETVNTSANTSTCNFTVTFGGNWALNIGARYSGNSLTINGTTHSFTTGALSWGSGGGSATIYTLSGVSIPHNADGTASLSVSATFACGIQRFSDGSAALPSINCSGTQALTPIARASAISSVTNPVNIGSAVAVTWTPAASAYTFGLYFWVGDLNWTIGSIKPASTSAYTYNWTVPTSLLYTSMSDITSLVLGVRLTTYNASGAELGSSSTTFTANIADSVKPSISAFSISPVNSNPVLSGWGLFVKGYTQPKLSVTAAAGSGSAISKYTVSGAGSGEFTSMPQTLSTISQSGKLTYTVVVADKRNQTASASTSITAYDYAVPTISSFIVSRVTGASTHAQMRASWSCSSVNGKNSATGTLSWRERTAASFTSYGTVVNGSTVSLDTSKVVLSDTSQYVFRLSVTDTVGNTVTSDYTVGTVAALMHWSASGNGITFGKILESDNFNVAQEAFHDQAVTAPAFKSSYGGKWEQYILHWADGNVYWTKIGTFTMNTSAEKATIRLFFESGYNGWATQHGIAAIHIQKAWQSAASTTNAFGISYQLSGWQWRDVKVQGRCTESNKLDLYFYTPFEYNSLMQVEITGNYDAFTLADTLSPSAPTDGVEQDCRIERILAESYYLMASDGNWYEPISVSGGSTYVGAGAYKAEITADEIKPSQSYSLALGAADRPWGRGYIGGLELYNSESGSSVYLDFHFNNSSADYTDRIIETAAGTLLFQKSGGYSNLTAAAFSQASSRHVKHDISDMDDPTETIMKLRPVSFYYNSDPDDQHMQYGLIAEEVEGVLPSIVTVPDGYKDEDRDYDPTEPVPGIDYSKLVPFLLAAIQHMEKRIEALEEKIKEVQE